MLRKILPLFKSIKKKNVCAVMSISEHERYTNKTIIRHISRHLQLNAAVISSLLPQIGKSVHSTSAPFVAERENIKFQNPLGNPPWAMRICLLQNAQEEPGFPLLTKVGQIRRQEKKKAGLGRAYTQAAIPCQIFPTISLLLEIIYHSLSYSLCSECIYCCFLVT